MLQPNQARPISSARNSTGGTRNSDPVSSTRRMTRSGSDWALSRTKVPVSLTAEWTLPEAPPSVPASAVQSVPQPRSRSPSGPDRSRARARRCRRRQRRRRPASRHRDVGRRLRSRACGQRHSAVLSGLERRPVPGGGAGRRRACYRAPESFGNPGADLVAHRPPPLDGTTMMFDWVYEPSGWFALGTLTVMEIILGIDNVIFISLIGDRLPQAQARIARILGLSLALVFRLACPVAAHLADRAHQAGDHPVRSRPVVARHRPRRGGPVPHRSGHARDPLRDRSRR